MWTNAVLKNPVGKAAKSGAVCRYKAHPAYPDSSTYVWIEWDNTDPRCRGQHDGGYFIDDFQVVSRETAYEIFMMDIQAAYKRLEELLNGTRINSTEDPR
jgi:hypothetical protein